MYGPALIDRRLQPAHGPAGRGVEPGRVALDRPHASRGPTPIAVGCWLQTHSGNPAPPCGWIGSRAPGSSRWPLRSAGAASPAASTGRNQSGAMPSSR